MKYLFYLLLFSLSLPLFGQERSCFTPEQIAPQAAYLDADPLDGCYPFSLYVEVDYPLHLQAEQRGQRIEDHIEGYLEEVRKLFEADGLQASFIVEYWKTPSPYSGASTSAVLDQFYDKINAEGGHPGNMAMLLGDLASGGINYVDILCNQSFGIGYSSINLDYKPYPEYSWDLLVFSHEAGHGLGSPHSHSCSWPGGAIDGCSPFGVEGNCDDPGNPPVGQASIMSYCHLQGSVGIDLSYGFGPLPLALIKNKIAGAGCVECVDGPDGPVADTCDGNEIIIEVLVDLWAQETSWELLDDEGEVVAKSEPFPKFPINYIYNDTLCLPIGCYDFVIKDVDGLAGVVPGYSGMYIVNGENSELASGQAFTNSETTRFCLGVDPPADDCAEIPINVNSLLNYSNQHRGGTVESIEGGIIMDGNTWKALPFAYTVTPATILKGEIWVDVPGEIHGIAIVDQIAGLIPSNSFRLSGRQGWGVEVEQVATGEWQDFEIPAGQVIENTDYTHIVFINDNDSGLGNNGPIVTSWRNIEMCEDGLAAITKSMAPEVQGTVEDEDQHAHDCNYGKYVMVSNPPQYPKCTCGYEARNKVVVEDIILKPYPNPATDTLTISYTPVKYQMYTLWGEVVRSGEGVKIDMSGLMPGAYFLVSDMVTTTIIKQ